MMMLSDAFILYAALVISSFISVLGLFLEWRPTTGRGAALIALGGLAALFTAVFFLHPITIELAELRRVNSEQKQQVGKLSTELKAVSALVGVDLRAERDSLATQLVRASRQGETLIAERDRVSERAKACEVSLSQSSSELASVKKNNLDILTEVENWKSAWGHLDSLIKQAIAAYGPLQSRK